MSKIWQVLTFTDARWRHFAPPSRSPSQGARMPCTQQDEIRIRMAQVGQGCSKPLCSKRFAEGQMSTPVTRQFEAPLLFTHFCEWIVSLRIPRSMRALHSHVPMQEPFETNTGFFGFLVTLCGCVFFGVPPPPLPKMVLFLWLPFKSIFLFFL